MHSLHGSTSFTAIAESMVHRNNVIMSWEELWLRNQGNDHSLAPDPFGL